jgi:hypothetical protein
MLLCQLITNYNINLIFSMVLYVSLFFSMFLYFALGSHHFWLADSGWLTLDSTWWWTDNT